MEILYFDPNGGNGTKYSVTLLPGQEYTIPNCSFSYPGYDFIGWCTGSDGNGHDAQPGDIISYDMAIAMGAKIFYAQWLWNGSLEAPPDPDSYTVTVTFDLLGGTWDQPNTITGEYQVTIPTQTPTRPWYSFACWHDRFLDRFIDPGSTLFADTDLVVLWQAEDYYIDYNLNDGEFTFTDPTGIDVYSEALPDVILPEPVLDGYAFAGWYDNPDFTGERIYKVGYPYTAPGGISLYAKWVEPSIEVHFHANADGSVVTNLPEDIYTTGNSITLPTNIPQIDDPGLTFLDWHLGAPDGLVFTPGEQIDCIHIGYVLDFYAYWRNNSFSITYELNGGQIIIPDEEEEFYEYTPKDNIFPYMFPNAIKDNYTFLGWYDNPECAGNPMLPLDLAYRFEDLTLYAKWVRNTATQVWLKNNNKWSKGLLYIKTNNTWKTGTPKININGNWTQNT